MFNIRYEISTSRYVFSRTVYSVFDYLSDVGGLISAFYPFCYILLILLGYRGDYMYVLGDSQVDKDTKRDSSKRSLSDNKEMMNKNKAIKDFTNIQWSCCRVLCFNMRLYCPLICVNWLCRCFKKSK